MGESCQAYAWSSGFSWLMTPCFTIIYRKMIKMFRFFKNFNFYPWNCLTLFILNVNNKVTLCMTMMNLSPPGSEVRHVSVVQPVCRPWPPGRPGFRGQAVRQHRRPVYGIVDRPRDGCHSAVNDYELWGQWFRFRICEIVFVCGAILWNP